MNRRVDPLQNAAAWLRTHRNQLLSLLHRLQAMGRPFLLRSNIQDTFEQLYAEDAGAERIGIAVRPTSTRVEIVVADDGPSIFGPDSYVSASDPVRLRSSVRTRTEADTAELRWSRDNDLNIAVLDLPRLGVVVPIGVDA